MNKYCVVVMDGARARLFGFDSTVRFSTLVERLDLVNPAKQATGRDLYSTSTSGIRPRVGGRAHAFDDHRDDHDREFARRFAREVIDRTAEWIRDLDAQCCVLAADSRMLGLVRAELPRLSKQSCTIEQVRKDLSRDSASQIHDKLASEGLIPARMRRRTRPGVAARRRRMI